MWIVMKNRVKLGYRNVVWLKNELVEEKVIMYLPDPSAMSRIEHKVIF